MPVTPVSTDLAYTQYAKLPHAINKEANDSEALQQAAAHFESLFIDMWLKSARDANSVFAEGNFMNSSEMKVHQEMFDHELAVHLAGNGGVGLAEVIVKQLSGEGHITPPHNRVSDVQSTAPEKTLQPSAVSQRVAAFSDAETFVAELLPVVEKATEGVSIPHVGVLSQAALETGWGAHVISGQDGLSHNLFGLKSTNADEANVPIATLEFELNRWVQRVEEFKSYPDWRASVEDYVSHLKDNPRYASVLESGASVEDFATRLADAGYATDPQYAKKLLDIASRLSKWIN